MRDKNYQAVIFDFDMTIADTEKVIISLLNQTADHFGYPAKPYEDVLSIVGNTHEKMLGHVTGVKDERELAKMREYYRMISRREMPKQTVFFPGLEECLTELEHRGMMLGVLSLKLKDIMLASLDQYGLTGYFSQILGCEDVSKPKPSPDGMQKMLSLLGCRAEEVLYVGDSLVDQETARNAGVDFGAMLLGGTRREQFEDGFPKGFFDSLKELKDWLCTDAAKGEGDTCAKTPVISSRDTP